MIIKLFDIQNSKVVPTEHCYTIKSLKNIMDKYPDDHILIYQYIFYMTCPLYMKHLHLEPIKELKQC